MKIRVFIAAFVIGYCLTGPSFAKEWANSEGSCYGKGSKNISIGMSLLHVGFYGAFDYGFHDAISGGIASGFNGWRNPYWNYHYIPIVVRAAFHPFNLSVLAEKIKIRNKLDAYLGIATGASIAWQSYRVNDSSFDDRSLNKFVFREYIGARFFPTENFYLSVEEGSGLGTINLGVGFAF